MREFFNYQSPYRTGIFMDLNVFEKFIPIVILFILGVLIYMYKDKFRENPKLEKRFRIIVGIVWTILYSSHYILRFALYGFDTLILPFQLCSIAMFFGIILVFTNNRTLFTFVMMTGIAGGLISLLFPILGYNSEYYRYYQFYLAHGILILIPIYYMLVHDFIPSTKEIWMSFAILQSIAVFMVIFNHFMNTDFMFVFIDQDKIEKFPAISKFGGIPFYLIWVEITGLSYFFIVDRMIRFIEQKQVVKEIKNA